MKSHAEVLKKTAPMQKVQNRVKFTYTEIGLGNLKDMSINQAFAEWLETESNTCRTMQLFAKEKN